MYMYVYFLKILHVKLNSNSTAMILAKEKTITCNVIAMSANSHCEKQTNRYKCIFQKFEIYRLLGKKCRHIF